MEGLDKEIGRQWLQYIAKKKALESQTTVKCGTALFFVVFFLQRTNKLRLCDCTGTGRGVLLWL